MWLDASPSSIHYYEFNNQNPIDNQNIIRPFINNYTTNLFFGFQQEYYLNSNYPNQENMGNKYFSKGLGSFTSYKLAYKNNFMFFSAEPFLLNVSENLNDNFYYPDYYTIQDQVVRPLKGLVHSNG